MMKDIVLAGSSGFAREIMWLIERINAEERQWNFLGFINNDSSDAFGDDEFLQHYDKELYVGIAVGNTGIRRHLYEQYRENKNLVFPPLVDPKAIVSDRVSMGMGSIICAGTIITVDVKIGDFTIINLDCTAGHGAEIGSFVTVNPGVNISGDVVVGNMVNIGTGSQILQGISIGDKTVIGAGAVVNRNMPGRCTAVGVPAKVIKRI